MKKLFIVLLSIFLVIPVFAGGGAEDQPSGFVPENTVVYFQVNEINSFLEQSNDAIQEMGFGLLLEGKTLADVLEEGFSMDLEGFSWELIDRSKSFGLAVSIDSFDGMAMGFEPEAGVRMMIPSTDPELLEQMLLDYADYSFQDLYVSVEGSYVIYDSGVELKTMDSFDESPLDTGDLNAVSYYIDVQKYMEMIDSFLYLMPMTLSDDDAMDFMTMFLKLFEVVKSLGEDMDNAYGTLVVDSKVIYSDAQFFLKDTAQAHSLLRAFDGPHDVRSAFESLPNEGWIKYAGNYNPEAMAEFALPLVEDITELFFQRSSNLDRLLDITEISFEISNGFQYGTFDFDMDFSALMEDPDYFEEEEDLAEAMSSMFDLDFYIVEEVNDIDAMKDLLLQAMNEQLLNGLINTISFFDVPEMKELLQRMSLRIETEENSLGYNFEDLSFKLSYDFDTKGYDTTDPQETEKMIVTINAFLDDYVLYFGFKDNKVVYTMSNPEVLDQVLNNRGGSGSRISDSHSFQEMMNYVPQNVQTLYSFSLSKYISLLMDMVASAAPGMGFGAGAIDTSQPGIIGYTKVEDDTIRAGGIVSIDELKSLTMPLIMFGMMAAGQP